MRFISAAFIDGQSGNVAIIIHEILRALIYFTILLRIYGLESIMNRLRIALASIAISTFGLTAVTAGTLANVKQRGYVKCGVTTGLPGFSIPNDKGEWTGLDVDFCRSVAAAIFGDAKKVQFSPLTAKDRFTALQSGEIDILSRNTTITMSRDTAVGLSFAGVNYYDGQGFLVRKSLNIISARQLDGASICTQTGTTMELNVADFFRSNGLKYEVVVFSSFDEVLQAYEAGRCEVFTNDASGLYSSRTKFARPDDHIVLPEIISKEPLGPAVRQGDDQWFKIARWVLSAQLDAEELGLTSANVEEKVKSTPNPEVKRLLGTEGEFGAALGLERQWAYNLIRQVGNYGESFERNLGQNSPLKIERGLNKIWTDGGLLYGLPVR
jgi:general L-amino acid transport system substrate-binding protein